MRSNICGVCGFTYGVQQLVYGPVMSICEQCVGKLASHMLTSSYRMATRPADWSENRTWYCSFCGNSSDETQMLIEIKASSHDCICNECIKLCIDDLFSKHPKLQIPIKLNTTEM
ncbi:MAG: ClpX C4-type zinc finger protein, partial [Gammaproteobacteria bacterium]